MTVIKDTVQQFTDLPNVSPNGYVVEIVGDEGTDFDNYYVKFTTNNGNAFEEGQWQETVKAYLLNLVRHNATRSYTWGRW